MVEWTAIPTEKMKRDAVSISLVTGVTVDIYRIFYKTKSLCHGNCFNVTVAVAFVVLKGS